MKPFSINHNLIQPQAWSWMGLGHRRSLLSLIHWLNAEAGLCWTPSSPQWICLQPYITALSGRFFQSLSSLPFLWFYQHWLFLPWEYALFFCGLHEPTLDLLLLLGLLQCSICCHILPSLLLSVGPYVSPSLILTWSPAALIVFYGLSHYLDVFITYPLSWVGDT